MYEKMMALAEAGKGRRLLNALGKKEMALTDAQLDAVLTVFRETGLPKQVAGLKSKRGILTDDQYDDLARKVEENCRAGMVDQLMPCLKDLISCGIKMNPARMEDEG